jgi:hypothetical protein
MRRRLTVALAALCVAAAIPPAGASASHTASEQVSLGAIGGNAGLPTQFMGASTDGTRVFLRTEEQLASTDTDSEFDLYERAGGVTTQISIGPTGGNTDNVLPQLRDVTADGTRVFFDIAENLTSADTDECELGDPAPNPCNDTYMWSGGVTTLISTGPQDGDGQSGARFVGASQDGTRAFFLTSLQLTASDTDGRPDIFERASGTTTLVSTGPTGGNAEIDPDYRGASADGTRVFFTTPESLVSGDTDSSSDVYQRSGGTTTLVSTGPAGGNGSVGATFEGASRDGTHLFFATSEQLVSGDTDSQTDIYERSGGTTTLISTGAAGGNGALGAEFKVVSEGGTRVLFETAEKLVASDTDSAVDVYERSGAATTLLSTGPVGGNANVDALFQGASSDGSRVVFRTPEALVAGDSDGLGDLYERAGGSTSLVSTSAGGGNGAFEAFFSDMSADGRRIFFETLEPLASDTDAVPDVYERFNGATTKVSSGTGGGNGDFIAVFLGASDDGSRVFFNSAEVLAGTDGDTASDVYVARIADSYVRPKGASPLRVPLVIAFRQCTAPNRAHGPPAIGGGAFDPSCAPPMQASDYLTVGTFDVNQKPVQAYGKMSFSVDAGNPSTPADEADVLLHMEMSDVRRQTTLDDYAGQLTVSADVKITDRQNGSVAVDPATVVALPFEFVTSCATTADTGIGSACVTDTSADAVIPGVIKEGFRSAWEVGQVKVYDGGSDGVANTAGNTLFLVQGIFVP